MSPGLGRPRRVGIRSAGARTTRRGHRALARFDTDFVPRAHGRVRPTLPEVASRSALASRRALPPAAGTDARDDLVRAATGARGARRSWRPGAQTAACVELQAVSPAC